MNGPIDTRQRQETPEGVELALAPAGPVPRAAAWAIDLAIRGVAYAVAGFAFSMLGDGGMGLMFIFVFLMEWGYPVVFEITSGSTPGKQAMSLVVLHDDGSPIDAGSAVLRNLIRFVDFLPMGYLIGLLSCLFTNRFQRLGDLAAGTVVVHTHGTSPKQLDSTVLPLAPQHPLSLEEQRAIVAFAERAGHWTAERQEELASHTGACTSGSDKHRVEQLKGYARWISGER